MGIVTISARAVARIAGKIAEDCKGVAALADRSRAAGVTRFISGGTKGVSIARVRDGIAVDIYIICEFGADVPAIRRRISEGITEKLGETGLKIKKVNVHIVDVKDHKGDSNGVR